MNVCSDVHLVSEKWTLRYFIIFALTGTNSWELPFFLPENQAKWSFVWYLDRSFHRFVTIHACDRQTDGQTEFSSLDRVCIPCSAVKNHETAKQYNSTAVMRSWRSGGEFSQRKSTAEYFVFFWRRLREMFVVVELCSGIVHGGLSGDNCPECLSESRCSITRLCL